MLEIWLSSPVLAFIIGVRHSSTTSRFSCSWWRESTLVAAGSQHLQGTTTANRPGAAGPQTNASWGLAGEPGHLKPLANVQDQTSSRSVPRPAAVASPSKPVRMGHLRPHLSPVHLNLHLNKIPGDQMHLEVLGEGLGEVQALPSGPLTPGVTVLPSTHGEGPFHPNNSQHWFSTLC